MCNRAAVCPFPLPAGFSLSYELGGTNILEMLKQAGVPVTWQVGAA